ncbi:3026_t:CDS:2 [Funneliformis mosseae]|uniref:3026_t:CDS:1 n=1 Tax=Funneliformis mosseae TaxID=27381 RepID=A0A9N8ZSP1_FUNMO|nr:3026_t:CDS:2 [Funneliformis mosseae]
MQASSYPTISDVSIINASKIDQYMDIMDSSTLVAAVLDPHTKVY